jgi:alpha-L-rhamnosidase
MLLKWPALLAIPVSVLLAQASGPLAPSGLRVEYLAEPVIDVFQPRFSWALNHPERGQKQSAYQVVVSAEPDLKTATWDSGKLASSQSTHIEYAGKLLESGQTYYWKVRYWDRDGKEGPYSATAKFDTGLFSASDWKGKFLGGGNQLRKEFLLPSRPVRARAYIAGLGYYELRMNGKKVGDHVLDPGWTTYDKRVLYVVYDVTRYLQSGANAVGIMLGQGWYGSRAALLQLAIECEGGQRVEIASDATWKTAQGPIVSDSIYNGETYDARLETPGWDRPGFDDAAWKPASLVEAPKGVLSAQMMPPIRVLDTIVPLKMTSPRPGTYVYDMGQNFSGWVELRVRGPRGAQVKLRHAELLYDDGTLNVENLGRAKATDVYTLRGNGTEEIYQPRFTYHGFRYVELTGFPGAPKLDTIRGKVVHSAVKLAGKFASSKTILNQIQHNILWGVTSNLESVPTDCNQRSERMGWMADAHLYAETAMLNFDMAAFYTNFLRDIHDIQGSDGTLTDTVPHKYGQRPADPAWGAAYPLIVWYVYQYQGDRRILEQHYEGVKAWTEYQRSRSQDGILGYSYYGDWVPVEPTPGDLVSTFYYYYSAHLTSRMAELLGKTADAQTYRKLAGQIREAFDKKFWRPEIRAYGNGTQTSQVLPLYLGLAPEEEKRRSALFRLTNDIVYGKNTHLTTGILGAKYVMELLTRAGRSDLAYELATQTTYPSWGYMIERGATTLWELWQEKTGPSMNSHNHPMFGSVGAWFYSALAGINLDPERPGYERIRIQPQPARDLQWASGSLETLRGSVVSSWRRSPDSFRLEVAIPVGSEAEIHLPQNHLDPVVVKESGRVVWKDNAYQPGAPGVTGARQTADAVVFEVGSGTYVFELTGAY